jgi:hypothetical protein
MLSQFMPILSQFVPMLSQFALMLSQFVLMLSQIALMLSQFVPIFICQLVKLHCDSDTLAWHSQPPVAILIWVFVFGMYLTQDE